VKRDPFLKALAALDTAKLRPVVDLRPEALATLKGFPVGELVRLPTFFPTYGTGKSTLYLTIARAAREHHERITKK
jgi:hypothetical protein